MSVLARCVLTVIMGIVQLPTFGQTAQSRQFEVPGHGRLEMRIPDSWRVNVRQSAGQLPPTITFSSGTGEPFKVLVTAGWSVQQRTNRSNIDSIRDEVGSAAKQLAPHSVERTLPVREVRMRSNRGYYFTATDIDPRPEFKYLTQGIILVGQIEIAFTVLTNDGQDSVTQQALDMLGRAVHQQIASP